MFWNTFNYIHNIFFINQGRKHLSHSYIMPCTVTYIMRKWSYYCVNFVHRLVLTSTWLALSGPEINVIALNIIHVCLFPSICLVYNKPGSTFKIRLTCCNNWKMVSAAYCTIKTCNYNIFWYIIPMFIQHRTCRYCHSIISTCYSFKWNSWF